MENKIVKIENGQIEATKELISNIKKSKGSLKPNGKRIERKFQRSYGRKWH